jgi:carboxylesterase type B
MHNTVQCTFTLQHYISSFVIQDQQKGMEWVKNNIEHFGGNKSKITLFGQSAGAASVAIHLTNDHSATLFDQVSPLLLRSLVLDLSDTDMVINDRDQ